MATVIPRDIDDSELIVRFAFEGDYKRKKPFIEEYLKEREIFFDNRYEFYPVSVLRKLYISSDDCISRGKSIQSGLKSLIVFKKEDFDAAVEKNAQIRVDFQAEIVGTPLDENNKYIPEIVEVNTETKGTPAHADIRFINPGLIEADSENANTAIRSFSSVLFKYCKVITLVEDISPDEEAFNKLFSLNEASSDL